MHLIGKEKKLKKVKLLVRGETKLSWSGVRGGEMNRGKGTREKERREQMDQTNIKKGRTITWKAVVTTIRP